MVIRSLKSGSFSRSTQVGNSIILPGDYESIATVTVGSGGSSSISFSSIPSTYKHLQIRCYAKETGGYSNNGLRLNGITTGFFQHRLEGDGSSASSWGIGNDSNIALPIMGAQWGSMIIDISDYTNTSKNKTVRMLGGVDNNGSGYVGLLSGSVADTSATTSVTLYSRATAWAQYSSFALYGIKGV